MQREYQHWQQHDGSVIKQLLFQLGPYAGKKLQFTTSPLKTMFSPAENMMHHMITANRTSTVIYTVKNIDLQT